MTLTKVSKSSSPFSYYGFNALPGWRYVWYASGALVFVMSVLRITVINLRETPKYLLGQGRDADVVELLQWLAHKYHRSCSLTLAELESCGVIISSHSGQMFSFGEFKMHLRGLFLTKAIGVSTVMIWFSWTLIGLAYP